MPERCPDDWGWKGRRSAGASISPPHRRCARPRRLGETVRHCHGSAAFAIAGFKSTHRKPSSSACAHAPARLPGIRPPARWSGLVAAKSFSASRLMIPWRCRSAPPMASPPAPCKPGFHQPQSRRLLLPCKMETPQNRNRPLLSGSLPARTRPTHVWLHRAVVGDHFELDPSSCRPIRAPSFCGWIFTRPSRTCCGHPGYSGSTVRHLVADQRPARNRRLPRPTHARAQRHVTMPAARLRNRRLHDRCDGYSGAAESRGPEENLFAVELAMASFHSRAVVPGQQRDPIRTAVPPRCALGYALCNHEAGG